MPGATAAVIVTVVSMERAPRTLRVELDLELGTEPLSGVVRDGSGAETPFRGWLELIQLVDRLRSTSAELGEAL
jgi:hypothetical protein